MLTALLLAITAPRAVATAPVIAIHSFKPKTASAAKLNVSFAGRPKAIDVGDVDTSLVLLADRNAIAIWPAIAAWGSGDLVRLRDAAVREGEIAVASGKSRQPPAGFATIVSRKRRFAFQLADALVQAGRREEGIVIMRRARGGTPAADALGKNDWSFASLWIATELRERGAFAEALQELDEGERVLGADITVTNHIVNRAQFLTEAGRAGEALGVLDAAEARFRQPGAGFFSPIGRINGSDRSFAAIRVCALTRLGRSAEADAAAAPLRERTEPRGTERGTSFTAVLRVRLARCTGDVAAAAAAYADQLADEPIGSRALLELQPGLRHPLFDQDFLAKVRAHPSLAPVLAQRMRDLPADLIPALNNWN